jgi:lipoprotein-releasing system permease protein
MYLPFRFALRYIFSKKTTNAINLISMISVFGIALGSMSLIVILSVFNGFEELLRDLIGVYKPDLHVSVKEGKVFSISDEKLAALGKIKGVVSYARILEEIALFEYDGIQNIGTLKGVDKNFLSVIAIDSTIQRGRFTLGNEKSSQLAVVGSTIEHTLQIKALQTKAINVYMPKRGETKKMSLTNKPFNKKELYPSGIFSVRQVDYDNTVIANLQVVQDLLSYKNGECSSIEIRTDPALGQEKIQKELSALMGEKISIKNRFQQDEAFFKITNIEKWVGFLIFAFTLVLVAFNMVGALWMLVLEKRKDIASLKAMGATNALVRNIFLTEGALLSGIGVAIGTVLAVIICLLQQQFGFIKLQNDGATFLIQAYPVSMRVFDILVVVLTVLLIGIAASLLPALRAARIKSLVRED